MDSIKNIQKDFMNFTSYNNILILGAASICIGLATKDAISDFMNQVVLPFILFLANGSVTYLSYLKAVQHSLKFPWLNAIVKACGKTVWILLVWFLILYITYAVFKKIIVIDLITSKVNLVEDLKKYIFPIS
jgi:hypothetical protein